MSRLYSVTEKGRKYLFEDRVSPSELDVLSLLESEGRIMAEEEIGMVLKDPHAWEYLQTLERKGYVRFEGEGD